MPEPRARLCLTMIVKDEAAIIERCLAAAAPWIDAYAVHDTGSSDATPALVESFFRDRGVPGQVTHGPFADFAQARNASLEAARATARAHEVDYLLLCDADMELVVDDPGFRAGLDADAYLVEQRATGLTYANVRLVRTHLPARYRGVTHEFLDLGDGVRERLRGAWFHDHAEGSNRAVKYERDLRLLEQGLAEEPDEPRYVFYLAQTLRELGRDREALAAYERRAALGGWEEEVWCALHHAAVLREKVGSEPQTVLAAYLAAYEHRPTRAETLVELSRYLREHGERHHLAHVFATRAVELPPSEDILFVVPEAYGWRARDELSITSYWVGRFAESAALAEGLLGDPAVPAAERPRIQQNLAYARARLP